MKKLLIIPAIFIASPIFALCSIDSNETICSLSQFQGSTRPSFQSQDTNLEKNKQNTMLQPLSKTNPIEKIRGPNVDMNYNSGCQFGVCLPNPNKSNLPNATD